MTLSLPRGRYGFKGGVVAKGRGGKGKGPGAWQTSKAYELAIATIVAARKEAGLTQRNVVEVLGKEPSWLAKIEKKERRMDLIEFIALSRALRIKEVDLLKAIIAVLPKQLEY